MIIRASKEQYETMKCLISHKMILTLVLVCAFTVEIHSQTPARPVTTPPIRINCTANEYKCAGSPTMCLPKEWVCDGNTECPRGDDEDGCCTDEEFRCSETKCIPKERRCDVVHDCIGGLDEVNCTYAACDDNQFKCGNGHCIPMVGRCNENMDCGDKTDEENCKVKAECAASQLKCKSDECIDFNLACNNQTDCADNSDEEPCGRNHCSANGGKGDCSHECTNTLLSFKCKCPMGYRLDEDGLTCKDINECKEFPRNCTQLCKNEQPGYVCSCAKEFTLQPDSKTCIHKDTKKPVLILANRYYIRRMDLNGSDYEIISDDNDHCHVISYDYFSKYLYAADASINKIKRLEMDGFTVKENATWEIVLEHGLPLVEGLAVDWISKKLYWTDSTKKTISVSETNGTHRKTLLKDRSDRPRAIVVHPGKGFLYWTDWSLHPFIARMGMDGSGFEKLITSNLFWPNALALDPYTNAIWWGDAFLNRIEMTDMDGLNRHVVLEDLPHIYSMAVFENTMYWTDWNVKTIFSANRFQGGANTTVKQTSLQPYGIHIYHPSQQPAFDNPCAKNNGGCSHLCLLAPGAGKTEAVCACPDHFNFTASSNKICEEQCNSGQFLCGRSDHKCIPKRWMCDGQNDCKGAEDEEGCDERKCSAGMFQCDNGTKCLYYMDVCDASPDCEDEMDEEESMCKQDCPPGEFKCTSGRCIAESWECDGEEDCKSGNDENSTVCEAEPKTCKPDEFRCDNGKCIDGNWRCDFDNDCGDNSDEVPRDMCLNTTCPTGWFRCKTNYRCIPDLLKCDGDNDCRDNSDEDETYCKETTCEPGDFQCKNGRCIPLRWRCDFDRDCTDGSDEDEERCKGNRPNCTESEFRCKNERCILKKYRCDMDNDCGDKSDEENCANHTCATDKYRCASGHCIDESQHCDGRKHCVDFTDEIGCPTRYPNGSYCTGDYFDCKNGMCIMQSYVCDGMSDCAPSGGLDEADDTCVNIPCNQSYQFRCPDTKRCISRRQFCDGHADCDSGADENNHTVCQPPRMKCSYESFTCRNGTCLPMSKVCDGRNDCLHGEDEKCQTSNSTQSLCPDLCKVNSNVTSRCTEKTTNGTKAFYCLCKPGYIPSLDVPFFCEDLDECQRWGSHTCSQECTNKNGNFTCGCHTGFDRRMTGSLTKCFPTNDTYGQDGFMLLAVDNNIIQYEPNKDTITTAAAYGRKINRLAVNANKGYVYWTDMYQQQIYRTKIAVKKGDMGIPQALNTTAKIANPNGIAVDWITNNIYVTDTDKGAIYVAREDGKYIKTLIEGGSLRRPTSIEVNPVLGKMYWVDETNKRIESANMDGTDIRVLVSTDIVLPKDIAVDYYMNNRIFWTDRIKDMIETIKPDGTDRNVVAKRVNFPNTIDVGFEELFWTSGATATVWRMSKLGHGVNVTVNLSYDVMIQDFKIFHLQRHPAGPDVVTSCAHLTVISPNATNKFQCVCADGSRLVGWTCTGGERQPIIEAKMCSCLHGTCEFNDTTFPACKCDNGWTGAACNKPVPTRPPTPAPVTRTPAPTKPTKTPRPTQPPTTTTKNPYTARTSIIPYTTDSGWRPAKKNDRVIKIVIPIVICIAVLCLIIIGIVMYRRKDLQAKVAGKFRAGPSGGGLTDETSVPYETMEAPGGFATGPMVVEYSVDKDTTRFSNPSYERFNNDTTTD